MDTSRIGSFCVKAGLAMMLLPIFLCHAPAHAENYVAGQLGMTFPQALSNGQVTQDGFGGLDISNQPLKNSVMLGAKFGHYFAKARWIGIETGLSYANPHLKEGSVTLSNNRGTATSGILPGVYQRMIIWDVATLVLRYPGYRLQPYVGIGPSLFFASLKGPQAPPGQSATAIGFNVEGGARYYVTRRWALFGEMQYHRARLGYTSNDSNDLADPFGFRATYSALTFSAGVSYHF